MTPIRIVLAGPQASLRASTDALRQGGVAVVARVDGGQAVRAAATFRPDVLLLEPEPGDPHAPRTVRDIRRASPRTQVLVVAPCAEPGAVREFVAAGAGGYLHKEVSRQAMLLAVHAAGGGAGGRGGDGAAALSPGPAAARVPPTAPVRLSRREHQVLLCAAAAMSNRQIANHLEITEGTVKRHLRGVFKKLGAVSRVDAVNRAVRAALIPWPGLGAPGGLVPPDSSMSA
ncbi:response regulator transcription factor [Allostreptomyces psammosilenae]|uniref:DNA-binding NarL/FixJ family response regulator n=1 Tax=Allostreptomyces psammosilenae TaxID=1892865 RepID=A0A853A0N3_9ACTN|nr:response regulator transcription factor [Allostreptomyces psammosilenae]NYI04072.1 DNA-binding NarL/FixJ family response regulator [Allostreptomyces psammosilenae]